MQPLTLSIGDGVGTENFLGVGDDGIEGCRSVKERLPLKKAIHERRSFVERAPRAGSVCKMTLDQDRPTDFVTKWPRAPIATEGKQIKVRPW